MSNLDKDYDYIICDKCKTWNMYNKSNCQRKECEKCACALAIEEYKPGNDTNENSTEYYQINFVQMIMLFLWTIIMFWTGDNTNCQSDHKYVYKHIPIDKIVENPPQQTLSERVNDSDDEFTQEERIRNRLMDEANRLVESEKEKSRAMISGVKKHIEMYKRKEWDLMEDTKELMQLDMS